MSGWGTAADREAALLLAEQKGHILAPFTPEQVVALNAHQSSGEMHEFTCGRNHPEEAQSPMLRATEAGWVCSKAGCDYTQDWASKWMVGHGLQVIGNAIILLEEQPMQRPQEGALLLFVGVGSGVLTDGHIVIGGVCCGTCRRHLTLNNAERFALDILAAVGAARRSE